MIFDRITDRLYFHSKKYQYSIPKDTMTIGIENRFKSHVPLALGNNVPYTYSLFSFPQLLTYIQKEALAVKRTI